LKKFLLGLNGPGELVAAAFFRTGGDRTRQSRERYKNKT
jgi:hypothetical protein